MMLETDKAWQDFINEHGAEAAGNLLIASMQYDAYMKNHSEVKKLADVYDKKQIAQGNSQ